MMYMPALDQDFSTVIDNSLSHDWQNEIANTRPLQFLCVAGMASCHCLQIVVIEDTQRSHRAAIEIERRNAESNTLKDDKDERRQEQKKPDPYSAWLQTKFSHASATVSNHPASMPS